MGESKSPTEEEIRDDGNRWVRMGVEPLDNMFLEVGQGVDDGNMSVVSDVSGVFDTGRQVRVGRKWKD